MGKKSVMEDLVGTLGDFTSKENWDKFFTIRGRDDSFEWYAEWPELRAPLLSHLDQLQAHSPSSAASVATSSPQILVPGCGNSRLSEHLYDAGFKGITNIDFSKVVISDMLRRNVRERPGMLWRVMDMTNMQFMDETFDAVLDKGGLDALMEPEHGPKLGNQYLSEVKRILKSGGKFICLTLAESHVLGLLFSKLRFGWKTSVEAIPQKPSSKPSLRTFMVVAEKEMSTMLLEISSLFNDSSLDCNGNQACGLHEALENENRVRRGYSNGSDLLYSLEDLQLGVKGDLTKLCQGRRFELTMGGKGSSYRAVLLDARQQSGPFVYHCGVFIVPKTRAHEWLFSSEEGQWMVVESSKAARLIMVILDTSHSNGSMDDIQKDLSPLVKWLAPGEDDNGAQIPFMMASDGIKQRNVINKVSSSLSGPIVVEDVVYENVDAAVSRLFPSKDLIFRRLIFERTESLVQSEALLMNEGSSHEVNEVERKKTRSSSKSKRKGARKQIEASNDLKVDHSYLASSYHTGIISGFNLISSYVENVVSTGKTVKAVVIGLGAGLLPMFLHECMPFLHIEVVELDPVILNLARNFFGFTEDKCLKVHIADGIQYVGELANSSDSTEVPVFDGNVNTSGSSKSPSKENCLAYHIEGRGPTKVDIIIIDVDSSDSSSGLTCPAADFVEESFLQTVKDRLSEHGLFVINLVSRSSAIKGKIVSRMKTVFSHLFSLQLEEDVNEVLFALPSEFCIKEDSFPEAALKLEKLLKFKHPEMNQSILEAAKKVRCLK
ncbi:eEF1A lysine and N-terminal methyltransferase isoform X2 [Juglans microcarpa x Juglans regia]|uniref:eEF1A lysine and N-terminal methyltransferase isoform X2 n=1 Tax=Juglans microcarpa x Juglans regia TaxID=2249226 RepID=UPI001B7E5A41|nr:eEF1A lysine and N-terminal methyltransferase isoform X2 [Juglans microcarpa x Juglans regia]